MPQENGYRSSRHSTRSTPLRANHTSQDNGTDKNNSNRDLKERGYYSELATINPEATFEVNKKTSSRIFFSFFKYFFFPHKKFRLEHRHQLLMMIFYEKHFACQIQLEVFEYHLK